MHPHTSNKKHLVRNPRFKGFSLVELLIVITVLGVITAIAIPAISGVYQNSIDATVHQNVQNLATLFNGSRGAGAVYASYDKNSIIDELTSATGVRGSGSMSSVVFRLNMGADAIAAAKSSSELLTGGSGEDLRFIYAGP